MSKLYNLCNSFKSLVFLAFNETSRFQEIVQCVDNLLRVINFLLPPTVLKVISCSRRQAFDHCELTTALWMEDKIHK